MKSPRLYYLNKSVIDSLGSTEQRKLQEKFVTLATFSSGTLAIIERGDQ
jgi:hypothetical protein